MNEYDPIKRQNAKEWMELDEGVRLALIREFHEKLQEELPDLGLHAAMHCLVENQVVICNDLPVAATLERLTKEGLDRHDAIHAIASIVCRDLLDMMKQGTSFSQERYSEQLVELTAKKWLQAS